MTSRPFYQQKFDQLKKIFPPKIGSIDDPILDKELIKKRQVKRLRLKELEEDVDSVNTWEMPEDMRAFTGPRVMTISN